MALKKTVKTLWQKAKPKTARSQIKKIRYSKKKRKIERQEVKKALADIRASKEGKANLAHWEHASLLRAVAKRQRQGKSISEALAREQDVLARWLKVKGHKADPKNTALALLKIERLGKIMHSKKALSAYKEKLEKKADEFRLRQYLEGRLKGKKLGRQQEKELIAEARGNEFSRVSALGIRSRFHALKTLETMIQRYSRMVGENRKKFEETGEKASEKKLDAAAVKLKRLFEIYDDYAKLEEFAKQIGASLVIVDIHGKTFYRY